MRIASDIANEFNEFSINYTNDMIACVPYYMFLIDEMTRDLPEDFNPENILDLGCGNGNVSAKVLESFPHASVTLVDASTEMLELCKGRFSRFSVEPCHSYFNDYPFPENSFDMITAGFSLHHCNSEEKQQLFRKIHTALKPGGIFGITDLMINKENSSHPELLQDWKAFVYKSFPDGEKWEWIMEHYDAFDKPDSLEDQLLWLQEAGFSDIECSVRENYWTYLRCRKL